MNAISSVTRAIELEPWDIFETPPLQVEEETDQSWLNATQPRVWSSCSLQLQFAPEQTAAANEILAKATSGSIACLQTGSDLSGVLTLAGQRLVLRGRLVRNLPVTRGVQFSASGVVNARQVMLAFSGALALTDAGREQLAGPFVLACDGLQNAFGGALLCQDVLRQDGDGPVPKKAVDPGCGKQIGEPVTRDRTLRKGPPPVKAHWRITRYEKCIIFETLDDAGNPIASQKLDKTNEDTIGQGDKAVGYGGNSDGLIEIPRDPNKTGVWTDHDVKKWGHFIFLYVTGCKEVTFFQYAHEVRSLTGEADKDLGWGTDPAPPPDADPKPKCIPYPGAFDAGDSTTGFVDCPGAEGHFSTGRCPKNKTVNGASQPLKDGDEFKVKIDFETFICCDTKLLGYYTWSTTDTYKYGATGWSDPVTTDGGAPVWHPDPTASPRGKDVTCP